MKKNVVIASLILVSVFLFMNASDSFAKTLPRFGSKSNSSKSSSSSSVKSSASKYVTPRLRSDRKALIVAFKNLRDVKMIEYTLTYNTNGSVQGVTGTIDSPTEKNLSRELVFGTESKGVFTYHTNITGMKFELTITLNNGKKIIKKYVIKV